MSTLLDATLRPGRAWVVPLLGLLLGIGVIAGVGQAEREPSATDTLPDGRQSTDVVRALESQPDTGPAGESTAVVLFAADRRLERADLRAARAAYARAGAETAPGLTVSEDRTAALGVVPIRATGATEVADRVAELRQAVRTDLPEGLTAQVTGPAAVQADLAAVFEGADLRLLGATATVVAILLILTYRSPLLWLVPLTVVGVADQAAAALATRVLDVVGVAWDESTVGILSVLVFGAGTDYALLLISRYRDELRLVEDRFEAMGTALRRTVEPVVASSTTVVVGLLTLLLSLFPTTRGLGLACAVGVVVAALAALVVLPFSLVLFGRWIFWPRVPHVGQTPLVETRSLWARVGEVVARRPGTLAAATVLALVALSAGTLRIDTGLSSSEQFLETPESITAGERLAESFPAGSADPTIVLAEPTAGQSPEQVATALGRVDGVRSARPGVAAGELTRFDLVLEAETGTAEARRTVEALRATLVDLGDPGALVGGSTAEAVDAGSAAERDRLLLFPLILVLVLVALGLLLRSVVAPLILVASVVGTYVAALGAAWLLFTGVLGFGSLDVGVPLLAFLFLVALGVDYNIFLVTRAGEEARAHGSRQGMLRALTATGGVITSAGVLLAAVFAVLGVLPLVVLAQLGTVICIGVLLDTLVVRTVLVPAVAVRLGDRFWWPRQP